MPDWVEPTVRLQKLRRELIDAGEVVGDYFHATTDTQAVRDRVFSTICDFDFRVQATICEKAKAQSHVTSQKPVFTRRLGIITA